MSTKYHHGYRIVLSADGGADGRATDLFEFTDRLRVVMSPIRRRLDATLLMDYAVTAIDGADVKGEVRPTLPLFEAMTDFDDDQRKMNPAHRGHDPHRFEVSFGRDPVEQGGTGDILALMYADRSEFTEAWESMPEVEPYGYWNNTDRPDDVTDAEWDERRLAWDRMLPGYITPVERMLSFSLRPQPPHNADMIDLVTARQDADAEAERQALLRSVAKSNRRRARNLAINLLAQETARRADEVAGPDGPKPDLMRIVSHYLFTSATDSGNYEAVVDAVEQALNDDVVDWALGLVEPDKQADRLVTDYNRAAGSETPPGPSPYALDLTAVHAAIAEHLDRHHGDD